jgi:hypothetical protein
MGKKMGLLEEKMVVCAKILEFRIPRERLLAHTKESQVSWYFPLKHLNGSRYIPKEVCKRVAKGRIS